MLNIELSALEISGAAAALVLSSLATLFLKLELFKPWLVAAFRTTLQLMLLGLGLRWVFSQDSSAVLVFGVLFALLNASWHISGKVHLPQKRLKSFALSFLSLISSVLPTGIIGLSLLGQEAWSSPRYVLPLVGMLFGNSINAIVLGINSFEDSFKANKGLMESYLCWGADPYEATAFEFRAALKTAMTPIFNTMSFVGLVSLPGMMTGKILGGSDPFQASLYQVLIMFLISITIFWGSWAAIGLTRRVLLKSRGLLT